MQVDEKQNKTKKDALHFDMSHKPRGQQEDWHGSFLQTDTEERCGSIRLKVKIEKSYSVLFEAGPLSLPRLVEEDVTGL